MKQHESAGHPTDGKPPPHVVFWSQHPLTAPDESWQTTSMGPQGWPGLGVSGMVGSTLLTQAHAGARAITTIANEMNFIMGTAW